MFDIREIFDLAIQIEKNGQAVYREAMDRVKTDHFRELLKWMSEEEGRHAEWFLEQKKKVRDKKHNPILEELNRELLSRLIEGQSFSLKDVDFSTVDHVSSLVRILVDFEKDTIVFYEMLKPFMEDEKTEKELDRIIEEENRHVKKIEDLIGKKNLLFAEIS